MLAASYVIKRPLLPQNVARQRRQHCVATVRLRPCHHQLSSISVRREFQRRLQSSIAAAEQPSLGPPPRSLFARALRFTFLAVFFTALGFTMATLPALPTINELASAPTDAETVSLYTPASDFAAQVNAHILSHPLTRALRADPSFHESRPHMKIPASQRQHNLTAGVLGGAGGLVVPPVTFAEAGGASMVQLLYLGDALCGHPGIVHGGMLATVLDEGLARCCFPALPSGIGVTASLKVDYRRPVQAGRYYVLRARTVKVEGRKAWVYGWIEELGDGLGEGGSGEEWGLGMGTKLVEAEALFVEPRQAKAMARAYGTQ